jgi:hypothetical protein
VTGYESETTTPTKTVAFLQGFPLGALTAKVKVTSAAGTATKTHQITIRNRMPSASLTVSDDTPVTGQQVTYTGTSDDVDSAGGSLNVWKFGDFWCSVVSTSCPWDVYTTSYSTPGTYTQWFGGEDADGGHTHVSKTVTVRAAPVATLSAPQSAIVGEQVELDASGSTGSGPLTYKWDVDGNAGNGYEVDGGTNPKRTITLPGGTRQVRVKITDNGGASAESAAKSIFVHAAPTAEFSYAPEQPVAGDTITLTSLASDDRGLVAQMWDLDGNLDNGFEHGAPEGATVTFDQPGSYVVRLKVNDMDGGTATVAKTIVVRAKDAPKDPDKPGDDPKDPPKGGGGDTGKTGTTAASAPSTNAAPAPAATGPAPSVDAAAPRVAPVKKAAPKRCKVTKAKKAKKGKKGAKARAAAKKKKRAATCAKPKKKRAAKKRRR